MTNLRDALKRAGSVPVSAQPDHIRIGEKTRKIVRRRRIVFSALSVVVLTAAGFSAFQIAEGNWFSRTSSQTDRTGPATTTGETIAVLHVEPPEPWADSQIKIRMENVSDGVILYGEEYAVERHDGGAWKDITGAKTWQQIGYNLPVGETRVVQAFRSLKPGDYRFSKGVTYGGDESRVVTTFTVAPDPEPPIVVVEPEEGEAISSPVEIHGNADVYEGTVSIRIRDEDGNVIAESFATATCSTGCRGIYGEKVRFDVDHEQSGTIEAYSVSAENGEDMHLVEVPVTLLPD